MSFSMHASVQTTEEQFPTDDTTPFRGMCLLIQAQGSNSEGCIQLCNKSAYHTQHRHRKHQQLNKNDTALAAVVS